MRRYPRGDASGVVVAGGKGQGAGFHQLNAPMFACLDSEHAVYVSDNGNYRVMKWVKDAKEGIIAAGGWGPGTKLTQLHAPREVLVDTAGTVYVVDDFNPFQPDVAKWQQCCRRGVRDFQKNSAVKNWSL